MTRTLEIIALPLTLLALFFGLIAVGLVGLGDWLKTRRA